MRNCEQVFNILLESTHRICFLPYKIIEKNTWVIAWQLSGFNISLETRGGGGGADISADNVQNLAEKQSLGGKCEVFVDNLSAKDIIS